jgi:hypothetical protein
MSAVRAALGARESFDPLAAAARARRAIGVRRSVAWVIRGVIAGDLLAATVFAAAFVHSFSDAPAAAAAALLAGVAAGAVIGIRRWPDWPESARAVDARFGLQDRLATALELRTSRSPLAVMQRADTGRRVAGLDLHETACGEFHPREAGVAALTVALVLVLAVLALTVGPSEQGSTATGAHNGVGTRGYSQAPAVVQQRSRWVVQTRIPQIERAANRGLAPDASRDAAIRRLHAALQQLRLALQRTTSQAGALRAISATQQELRRIASSLHPISPAAVSQLDRALFTQAITQRRGGAGSSGSRSGVRSSGSGEESLRAYAAAAGQLNRLASKLESLSTSERTGGRARSAAAARRLSALKLALARAANAVSNPTLRSALQRAASSLAAGDAQSAARALRQAASSLNRSPAARQAQARLGGTASALDSAKGDLTGLANGGSEGSSTSKAPAGLGSANGAGAGTGSVNGVKSGPSKGGSAAQSAGGNRGASTHSSSAGDNTRQAQAGGTGRGHGSGEGSGGTGGHGNGGDRGTAGSQAALGHGRSNGHGASAGNRASTTARHGTAVGIGARIYVPPVRVGNSAHTIQSGGPNGATLPGSTVPYHQVLGRFQQSARAALDQAPLPPVVKSFVRRYFSAISR